MGARRGGNLRSKLIRAFWTIDVDYPEPSQKLLGLCERAVGDGQSVLVGADQCCLTGSRKTLAIHPVRRLARSSLL